MFFIGGQGIGSVLAFVDDNARSSTTLLIRRRINGLSSTISRFFSTAFFLLNIQIKRNCDFLLVVFVTSKFWSPDFLTTNVGGLWCGRF